MITICTIITEIMKDFLPLLFESIKKGNTLISHVNFVNVDDPQEDEWEDGKIKFKKLSENRINPERIDFFRTKKDFSAQHALNLHTCIDLSETEYVFLVDPDTFLYPGVDKFYLEAIENFNLDIIGVSHHVSVNQAFSYFPCAQNLMISKNKLPGEDFLRGKLKMTNNIYGPTEIGIPVDGKYLIPGPIAEYMSVFPNKTPHSGKCVYDVGCNLWLWAQEKNWRWLAFQTEDCYHFASKYFRSNFKPRPNLRKINLACHAIGGSRPEPLHGELVSYLKSEYDKIIDDDDDD